MVDIQGERKQTSDYMALVVVYSYVAFGGMSSVRIQLSGCHGADLDLKVIDVKASKYPKFRKL